MKKHYTENLIQEYCKYYELKQNCFIYKKKTVILIVLNPSYDAYIYETT